MSLTEAPGRLTIVENDQLLASLHYLTLADDTWVLEQIFVRPSQSTDLAVQLIKRFTSLANAAAVPVKLLDPYAKAYFATHPVLDHLADHQLPVRGPGAVRPVD